MKIKKLILFILAGIIISGCATGYPKVTGELMRVYVANREDHMRTYADNRTPRTDDCITQVVPTGGIDMLIVTKDKVFEMGFSRKDVKEYKDENRSGVELSATYGDKDFWIGFETCGFIDYSTYGYYRVIDSNVGEKYFENKNTGTGDIELQKALKLGPLESFWPN